MTPAAHFCALCGGKLTERHTYGALRPVCGDCGHIVFFDPKVAVIAFIQDSGRVLLIRRAGDPGKGKWAFPAGFVDAGEDPQLAAQREALEETNLQIQIDKLLDVYYSPPGEDGDADIIIVYTAHVIGGTLQAGDDAEAAEWFMSDAMPELVFNSTFRLIERWRSGDI